MGFGLNLRAGGEALPYWELVDRVAAWEAVPSIRSLGYPPHITLAKYVDVDAEQLRGAVSGIVEFLPLTLTFDRIGSFDPGFLILWAAPQPHPMLHELHARVHAAIDPERCDPYYRPGLWMPHCSIALHIAEEHRDAANQLIAAGITPFSLTFDVVDCLSAPPVAIIAEHRLLE
jgi:2'-5' RNA ligase